MTTIKETGSLLRKKGSGKKPALAARLEHDRQAFQRSPRKSIRRASLELGIPKTYCICSSRNLLWTMVQNSSEFVYDRECIFSVQIVSRESPYGQKDHIIEPNNKKKKYLNPEDPRDAEEIMNILENLSDDDEICSEIDKADDLNLILLPPQDGQDSDCDDAPSDDERLTNFRDIGKGVLLQPLEVQAITRSEQIKYKTDVLVQPSTSSESNNGTEQVQRDKRIPRQWLSKELDFTTKQTDDYFDILSSVKDKCAKLGLNFELDEVFVDFEIRKWLKHTIGLMFLSPDEWEDVKAETIKNCFRKAGYSKDESYSIEEEELDEPVPEEWSDFQNVVSCQENYDSFVNVDADILIAEHPTDEEIIESVTAQQNDSKLDNDMDIAEDEVPQLKPTPSAVQALDALATFRCYIQGQSSVHEDVFGAVNLLENFVENRVLQNKKQKKMTDFFSNI
ncbi:hypothetical protein C0J52_22018 [Blattella germanica]|nr:hypothetical protein C0J52_22018 [Blattella germanica]